MLNYRLVNDKTNAIIEEPFFDKATASAKADSLKTTTQEEFRVVVLTTVYRTAIKIAEVEIDF